MKKANGLTLLLVGFLAVPASLLAQHEQHHPQGQQQQLEQGMMSQGMMGQGMMGQGMMGQGMMGQGQGMMSMMSGPSPLMVLMQKVPLELSESQVERLQALANEATQARQNHQQEMQLLHRQAQAALNGDTPDLAAYESALRAAVEHHVALQVQTARLFQQALDVLSPEQRSNLRYGMRLMDGMMSGGMMSRMMQGGGMAGCPMMGEMGND